jgi:protein-S-isoprenylcysteine O-methyltransferase Ste14
VKTRASVSDPRPVSDVSHAVGIAGLLGLAAWIVIARNFGAFAEFIGFPGFPARADGPYSAMIAAACCGGPMLLWSILVDKVHLRTSTGIDWKLRRPVDEVLDTSIIKIAGLWATWALIAAFYAVFRYYWRDQYLFSMQMLQFAAIPLVIASVPYVIWLDRYLVNPRDGSWHFGAWLSGRSDWDKTEVLHHLRAWAVKGFFIAFMIGILPGGFQFVVNLNWQSVINNPATLASALITGMFMIDVQFAAVGYVMTLKPLDAHIRTANPHFMGWFAALVCYPPFTLMDGVLNYHQATRDWAYWFDGHTMLLYIWGSILVILTAIYAWATVAFGIRFSNLTHRGTLTHGPYSFTRHPAYLSKNMFWWLSTLPFLVTTGSTTDMVRNTVILGLVSAIYYWRARTEEKHLLTDPDYAAYYNWMERNAPVPRFFVGLKSVFSRRFGGQRTEIQPAE